jgi:diaminohydroxyphosphoribosylaminopyrimidine deaminase / 5-amino-6-(5-phosphoribosylamino)uracil reductase
MTSQDLLDSHYMARALQLARLGLYTTDPNPRVGCVLVKDGRVIGEGWHKWAGQAHAEVEALRNATENPEGATAYVSLEPCSHHGKTPPCCDALIQAGISRVVAATKDPNPLVAGKGLERLRQAGIDVATGLLEADAKALNRGFISRMTRQRPFVRSKLAMSVDGRTAMASGESQWITSAEARADVHKLRAECSAILTGINTVIKDNPALTARIDQEVKQPLRVILDSSLNMPADAKMAKLPGFTLVLTCSENQAKTELLRQSGIEVKQLPEKDGSLDLPAVMAYLAQQQVNEVLVEAGSLLNGSLLTHNLVDEWIVYLAPKILGDQGRGLFSLPGLSNLSDCKEMKLKDVRQVGGDLRLILTP